MVVNWHKWIADWLESTRQVTGASVTFDPVGASDLLDEYEAVVGERDRLAAQLQQRDTAMLAVVQQVFDEGGCDFCHAGTGVAHAPWCIVPILTAAMNDEGAPAGATEGNQCDS